MVKEVLFHIGDPKTGTTSIQEMLATGNWRSPSTSLFYSAPINHLPLAKSLYEPDEKRFRDKRFKDLAIAIAETDADIAVVSAELFEHVEPAALRDAIAEFLPQYAERSRFIAYVRPHAERLTSAYAERIKQGFTTGTLDEFHESILASQHLVYAPRFLKWRAIFGDRLTVRPMIRDRLKNRDVVYDFLTWVFGDQPFEIPNPGTTNESLALEDLAMLRELHVRLGGKPKLLKARRSIGWNFALELASMPRPAGTKPALHKGLVPAVIAAYRTDAAEMDAAFFCGEPTLEPALLAAGDRAVDAPQSSLAQDHFSPDEMRLINVWIDMVELMLGHKAEDLPAHFRSRQRALFRARLRGEGAEPEPVEGIRSRSPKLSGLKALNAAEAKRGSKGGKAGAKARRGRPAGAGEKRQRQALGGDE